MNRLKWGAVLLLLLLVGAGYELYALHRENQQMKEDIQRLSHIVSERPIELSTFMAAYERFVTKLYLAGHHQNWPLAEFYHEELEETAEQLEALRLSDDGIPVSAMMRPNLIEPLEAVEKAIHRKNAEDFEEAVQHLITRCNSCHAAAGKPYIYLQAPHQGKIPQQSFHPR
ncbi:MAG: hypothetical protein N2170_06535 [Bacteroidia bacterium]|nr:hypothetical protein [Bacteroidia bacterium]